MYAYVCEIVVVEAGPSELPIVEVEAERLDEVQGCADVRAQADDVASVAGDLRGDEHDVERFVSHRPSSTVLRSERVTGARMRP